MAALNRSFLPNISETLRCARQRHKVIPQRRHLSRTCTAWDAQSSEHAAGTATVAEVESARTYCAELLRKYDRPSYTLSTFIPAHAQNFYIALRALNVSLSMIPDTTSSYTIGLMRLQFWRDTIIRTLSGSPPKEPVAVLLGAAVADLDARGNRSSNLSSKRSWFLRMINAREQTLTNAAFPNLEAVESYAENTYSTLLYLTLSALPMNSITADHVASHIGKAAGISAVLRGVPLVAFPPPPNHHSNRSAGDLTGTPSSSPRQGTITLPLDVMAQCGVREEDVFRQGADAPGLRDAVFTVATRASDHLITARQMIKNLKAGEDVGHAFEHEAEEEHQHPQESTSAITKQLNEVERSFGVFMPAVVTQLWLDKLQKVDFDIFNKELLRTDWRLPWKAYFAYRRREF